MSNAEKVRQVLRRLARRPGPPPPQSLPQKKRRRAPPGQDAERSPSKKIPGLGTLGQLVEAWAEGQPRRSDQAAIARAVRAQLDQVRPHQLTELEICGLTAKWQKAWAPATYYNRLQALRRFLRSVERISGVQGLATAVPKIHKPGPRRTIAKPDELERLARHAQHWLRCWLLLTTELGCRISESARLCEAGWNRDKHTVSFQTKGHRTHVLPLTPEAEALFESAPPSDDPLQPLLERIRGAPASVATIHRHWQKLKARAGVNPLLRPHDLRRTSAVALYELCRDIRTVSHFLGHRDLGSTVGYLAHYDPQTLRPLLKQLWTPRREKEPIQ